MSGKSIYVPLNLDNWKILSLLVKLPIVKSMKAHQGTGIWQSYFSLSVFECIPSALTSFFFLIRVF